MLASFHCVERNIRCPRIANDGVLIAIAADWSYIWIFRQVYHQSQVPCCFSSYLLQSIFLLGKKEHQVLVRWEVLAADQLWMGPQGWSGLASPRDAPPREKECLSCLCSDWSHHCSYRVRGMGFRTVNSLYCLMKLMRHICISIVLDFGSLGEPPRLLYFAQLFLQSWLAQDVLKRQCWAICDLDKIWRNGCT